MRFGVFAVFSVKTVNNKIPNCKESSLRVIFGDTELRYNLFFSPLSYFNAFFFESLNPTNKNLLFLQAKNKDDLLITLKLEKSTF